MCHLVVTRDLTKLYHGETKRINEAVKNNLVKFPDRFSFVLNDIESNELLDEIFDQKRNSWSELNRILIRSCI